MGPGDEVYDGQAQPGSALRTAPADISPAEPLESVRQEIGREPRPLVEDLDND
jgi:hypothetical protein